MMDLTYNDLSPWLTEPVADIIAFENWVGNKLYGIEIEQNTDFERALGIAKLFKEKPPVGVAKIGEWGTAICPVGRMGEIGEIGVEVDKTKIPYGKYFIIPLAKGETKKIRVKLHGQFKIDNKNNFLVDATGGDIGIIIDTHGR
jgi:hypothetical protein